MKSALLVVVIAALCFMPNGARSQADPTAIACVCKCCYLGECQPLENASWFVASCDSCTAQSCRDRVASPWVRKKVSHVFEALQEGVPEDVKRGMKIDVCEVISVLEEQKCARYGSAERASLCKRTTGVEAECYDRQAFLHKFIIWMYVVLLFALIVFGFTMDYLPSFQTFKRRHFAY